MVWTNFPKYYFDLVIMGTLTVQDSDGSEPRLLAWIFENGLENLSF